MTLKDVFHKDPTTFEIPNEGVANVTQDRWLKFELDTFVCEAQYSRGIEQILSSYLDCLGTDRDQKAAWVSGFYGSGKSHLVKVLAHLWVDTQVDGRTARELVSLPDEPKRLLRELSTRGAQFGGLHSVIGSMKEGAGGGKGVDDIRLALLGLVFRSAGVSPRYEAGRFCLRLRKLGILEAVRDEVVGNGSDFDAELLSLTVSGVLHTAVLNGTKEFGESEKEIRESLRAQYPLTSAITQHEMIVSIDEALRREGKLPLTVIVLDELQQFIGEHSERAYDVQEVVEAVCKEARFGNRLLFLATGQSAITETAQLQRLQARFIVRVNLTDTDVERVVRKVVLEKKPAAVAEIKTMLAAMAGEIDRQLPGTRIAPTSGDQAGLVADYPLLPARRRFWERALRALDEAGTQAMLRSQLSLVHKAVQAISGRPLGAVVPADALYDYEREKMVSSNVLTRDIEELIERQRKDENAGTLKARICALVFIISKLDRSPGADIGIRADARTLTDLMVDDLATGHDALAPQIEAALKDLVTNAILAPAEQEYQLQTEEIAEWNRARVASMQRIKDDAAKVSGLRSERLKSAVEDALKGVRPTQGKSKTPRKLEIRIGGEQPRPKDEVPVWVRDAWSEKAEIVRTDAMNAGLDSPILFVFLPQEDALKDALAGAKACEELLIARGTPNTPEGREARRVTESRQREFEDSVVAEIEKILHNAQVFLGGGSPVEAAGFRDKVEEGAKAAMARLFNLFEQADNASWKTVESHAKQGSEEALRAIGHDGPIEDHPVARQILQYVGAGRKGSEVLANFEGAPFGWPQDAITATLYALLSADKMRAKLLDAPVTAKALDGQKLKGAQFAAELVPLSASDKVALKGLFQRLVKPNRGQELEDSERFLASLEALGRDAGGDAPAPSR